MAVPAQSPARRTWADSLTTATFLIPGAFLLLAFLVAPFVFAMVVSFTNLRLISPLPVRYIGLENYVRTLNDEVFRHAFLNNVTFVLIVVPVQTLFALGLALLVNQKVRGVKIFRTIYFAPVVTVMAVAATVWKLLYEPDSGMINTILRGISGGHLAPAWLFNPSTALPAVIIMSIWQGVGFQMIILLAGLQGISHELYEGAAIDGANAWQQFISVTLPQMRNTLIFVVTITIIYAFRLFDQVFVMTGGGPLDSTQTMMTRIITVGFGQQKIGQASAISVIFFGIVLAISLIQRTFIREEREVQ